MERAYRTWRAFQDRVLAPLAALALFGCTLIALLEVFRRYVLGLSFYWQQDFVTYVILGGVFLYFCIAQRSESHLTVSVFLEIAEALGPRARRAAEVLRLAALSFSFAFLLAVVWWGIPEVRDSQQYDTRTESLLLPLAPFLWLLLAGFAFMAVQMFFQVWRGIQKLRGRDVLAEPGEEPELPR